MGGLLSSLVAALVLATLGAAQLRPDTDHTLVLAWDGTGVGAFCRLKLDGKPAGRVALRQPAPNGLSYLHLLSAAESPGPGMLLESVQARVR